MCVGVVEARPSSSPDVGADGVVHERAELRHGEAGHGAGAVHLVGRRVAPDLRDAALPARHHPPTRAEGRRAVSSIGSGAFRLGVRLGRYRAARWMLAGLERIVRWTVMAVIVVVCIAVAASVLAYLNYAPLWFRVYNRCTDSRPEAASITEIVRHNGECMSLAGRMV